MRLLYFVILIGLVSSFGCNKATDESIPANMPQLFVPTAFTPNGDHINDTFLIKTSGSLTYYHIAIYDNSNITVYQSNNILSGWTGNYQNEPEPSGSYLWVINYSAEGTKVVQTSGYVELIR
jgi:gliding motility-associated-like protein